MVDGIKKLQEELSALERELHYVLPKELQTARSHGDLSENAEYHGRKRAARLRLGPFWSNSENA